MGIFGLFKKKPKQEQLSNGTNEQYVASIPKQITIDNKPIDNFIAQRKNPSIITKENYTIEPAENRSMDAIPSKRGLFPHEILVLNYAPTFYTSGNTFQQFWLYKYGIQDVQAILTSLQERGFIEVGNLQSTLEQQAASNLVNVLKEFGIKTTGKKDELIKRVLEDISEQELTHRFPNRTYVLTDAGKAETVENEYVLYIHRHAIEDLDIWSLNKLVHTPPYFPYRDKIWGYLSERALKHFCAKAFSGYSICRLSMAIFLREEDKFLEALEMLAEVAYCDLSGTSNGFMPEYIYISTKHYFPYEKSIVKIAPMVISYIVECQEKLNYSDDELVSFLAMRMAWVSFPFHLFTVEECAKIVLLERDKNVDELKKLYAKAKRELQKQHPEVELH